MPIARTPKNIDATTQYVAASVLNNIAFKQMTNSIMRCKKKFNKSDAWVEQESAKLISEITEFKSRMVDFILGIDDQEFFNFFILKDRLPSNLGKRIDDFSQKQAEVKWDFLQEFDRKINIQAAQP